MIDTDVAVIGGGVIGLSCVNQIPSGLRSIVLEKNGACGQETSSRNSEVIHSGIYYPHGSKKTEHCKVGRNELYRFCQQNGIDHRQCGKLVVAAGTEEVECLEKLAAHCEYEVIPFQRISKSWLQKKFDFLQGQEAIYFPLSGIFNTHQYLLCLESKAQERGVTIALNCRVINVLEREPWVIEIEEQGKKWCLRAKVLINAAGFEAAHISNQALEVDDFEHRVCRGRYLLVNKFLKEPLASLIYPIPEKDGLGIHLTPDLSGQVRLGPDVDWSVSDKTGNEGSVYDCDWEVLKTQFLQASKKMFPLLEAKHLSPGFVGIRPKLFVKGEPFGDFWIERKGHLIHLLGIESPGLTASLSIGAQVGRETGAII